MKDTKENNHHRPHPGQLPRELRVALQNFRKKNDKNETHQDLFNLLQMASESDTFGIFSGNERSNYFHMVRNLGLLIDAVYKHPI